LTCRRWATRLVSRTKRWRSASARTITTSFPRELRGHGHGGSGSGRDQRVRRSACLTIVRLWWVEDNPPAAPALEFKLQGVYPNPFNPSTTFRFDLPEAGQARIVLFDLLGRVVREIDLGRLQRGSHEHLLDASSLASGAYYGRLEFRADRTGARNLSHSARLMLVK
jgi:hypothetical protein